MEKSIPYVETHLATSKLIVDIRFINGTYNRGNLCSSLEFKRERLVLYKDIVKKDIVVFDNVEKIEVTSEVFGRG